MKSYYVQVGSTGASLVERFWMIDGDVAHQDILPSELGTHHADPNQDILVTVRRRFPMSQFYKLDLGPGEYYPRMARPTSTQQGCSPGHNPDKTPAARNIRTTSTGQLHALIQQLQEICRVVHPSVENFTTYGHEIRNLIIIACTEVEAHWKNILKANNARGNCTIDYVKLSPAMKLPDYRVALPWYPWLDPIAPFHNWSPSKTPSKDLSWYDAYNSVKHDRENDFRKATLECALQSLSGCFVMLCAQYGWDFARKDESTGDAFFRLIDAPKWQPSDIYIPAEDTRTKSVPYPF